MIDNYIHTWVYVKQTFWEDMPHGEKLYLFLTDVIRELTTQSYDFDENVENESNKHT